MRTLLHVIVGFGVLAVAAFGAGPSAAQSPQSYPYCALDSSIGATSCYYSSRAQCGSHCIENPSYRGFEGTMGSARGRYGGQARH
jgi:hypothetical protein